MKLMIIWSLAIILQSSLVAHSLPKFNALKNIIPGSSNQNQVTEIFGKPNRVLDLKDLQGSSESGPLREYFDGDGVKFSVSFEPQGRIARGWAWSVLKGDSEQDLKTALSQFPGAFWEAETVKWVNPHQVPMECYFKDRKQGISIEYSRARKEVTSISRWNPGRALSSTDDEKPPRFCIANSCTDARLSKDVFKDKPLCEVPK